MSTAGLVAILLIAAGIASSKRLGRFRAALGLTHLAATGHVFLVLGYLIGLTLGDAELAAITPGLMPIMAFVTGWIGFSVGMAFRVDVLKLVPLRAYRAALAPGIAAGSVVGGAAFGLMAWLDVPLLQGGAASLILAGAAATSAPTLAAAVRARRGGQVEPTRGTLRMIEFTASLDNLLTVVAAILAFSLLNHTPETLAFLGWAGMSLGAGVVVAVVTWLFLGGNASDNERLLLGLAMLAFAAGLGGWLEVSPAAVGAIAGFVLVNLPGERMELLGRTIRRIERPAVVILMAVVGVYSAGVGGWLLVGAVVLMTVVRAACKFGTGQLVAGPIHGMPGLRAQRDWGLGLIPQGTLGLVVALSLVHVWPDPTAQVVLAGVAIASVINEIAAPRMLLRALPGVTV